MSQYPGPYQAPTPYPGVNYAHAYPMQSAVDPYANLRAPAKRAAVALFVVGGLALLGGLCAGAAGFGMSDRLMDQLVQQSGNAELTPELMRVGFVVMGGCGFVLSLALIVLGIFVWRNSFLSAVLAIIVSSIMLLLCLGNAISSLSQIGRAHGGSQLGGMLCAAIVPCACLAILITMLVQAMGGIKRHQAAHAAYQAHYWQAYQQQQQMYQQQSQQPPPQTPLQ